MLGAIIGDIVGSIYEKKEVKDINFELIGDKNYFTDDTVLTISTAETILNNKEDYGANYKKYALLYPNCGYGKSFKEWSESDSLEGYGSYGNGSAMRVSPIGFWFKSIEDVRKQAIMSSLCTHDHEEGIRGAEAIASSVFLARNCFSKKEIKKYIENNFKYNLDKSISDIKSNYFFSSKSEETVPQAIIAFLNSENFEDAIRKAVFLGGDTDTIASMAGGIAEAFYINISFEIKNKILFILPEEFRIIIFDFYKKIYGFSN